ncbi:MAG: YkgJ family cysteine cluster protein [Deltaproteobacteria bacterium]|nr:MAG: YkgJ family cysteine cluster protein [Deltaproteobacteria bacterium]
MALREKKKRVGELYERYELLAKPYTSQAVCSKGCASCCIDVGSVGATTLEGLIILEYLQGWDPRAKQKMNLSLQQNRNEKLNSALARCAFLDQEQRCLIYPVRPFSCRRLYSVRRCDGQGPVIHRRALQIGKQMEQALQKLDPEGCSGHLSFVLDLMGNKEFLQAYLRGDWNSEEFREIIQPYGLVVHKDAPTGARS